MEKIWEHCFNNELRIDPADNNLLVTEAPGNPKSNREKMAQLLFDTFNVRGLYIVNSTLLPLYANGRTTGLSIEAGDGVVSAVPVFEGLVIPHTVKKNFISGRVITDYMNKLIIAEGTMPQANASSWHQVIGTLKERVGYIALDY